MNEVLGLRNANGVVPKEPILHSADPDLADKNNNGGILMAAVWDMMVVAWQWLWGVVVDFRASWW